MGRASGVEMGTLIEKAVFPPWEGVRGGNAAPRGRRATLPNSLICPQGWRELSVLGKGKERCTT